MLHETKYAFLNQYHKNTLTWKYRFLYMNHWPYLFSRMSTIGLSVLAGLA